MSVRDADPKRFEPATASPRRLLFLLLLVAGGAAAASRQADGRAHDQMRPITIDTTFVRYPEGSALYRVGHTLVLCNGPSGHSPRPVFAR